MTDIGDDVKESLSLVEDLKFFLATAPANWQENQVIRRYYLNNDEGFVSCVFWNNLYFITGTDIVRCILYKFQHFGRTVTDRKKFEEGVFSDLRNLKAGTDSVLENPKSEFLEFLYKNSCLRTQKKQKVFFWFNVPHDKLMADALERDIKKEKAGQPATSVAMREPALSFNYVEDKSKTLYDQLSEHLNQPKFEQTKQEGHSESGSPEFAHTSSNTQKYSSDTSYTSQPVGDKSKAAPIEGNDINDNNDNNDDNNDDEDDDFPLDYLDHGPASFDPLAGQDWAGRDYNGRDYITLDSHPYSGAYVNAFDSDFDGFDSSVLQMQNSVNVVSNDDYLIEQTVPARAVPGMPSASQLFYPRSAKLYDEQAHMHPFGNMPSLNSALGLGLAPYAYDSGFHGHEFQGQSHPHMPYESEYLHQQQRPDLHSVHGYGYGYPDEFDYLMRNGIPSQRQQDVSASMMRKRRQLQGTEPSVSKVQKPSHRSANNYESRLRVQIKKEEEMSAAIPTPEGSIHMYNGQNMAKHL